DAEGRTIAIGGNTTFKVAQAKKDVNFTIENITYGQDAQVTVYANQDGAYTIIINDMPFDVNVNDGVGTTIISGLDAGQDIVATISINDPNYEASNTTTFTVLPKEINVTIAVTDITYGEDAIVTITADVDGNYIVTFNNIDGVFNVTVEGGVGSAHVPGLNVETNAAFVNIDNSNYIGTNSTEFTVSPKPINVSIAVTDITYGENAMVTVIADVDGRYIVRFNNIEELFLVTVENGIGSILVSELNGETNTAFVNTSDNNYIGTNSTTFTVSPRATAITAANVAKVYNVGKNYVVYLKDNLGNAIANAAVSVKIGSKTYTKNTDANGKVTIAIENLKPATYKTTITFAGNTNYAPSSLTTSQIVVSRANPKLTASAKTYKVSATKNYVATLKSNTNKAIKGATLSLKVNGKTYKAKTNAKGQATFKITNLKKKGTFATTVSFSKDAYYNAVSKKVKIVVK
ncbi:autotransporter outer membrane beta-barrel domain-containing protein, partial [Methanobrevibacter sp.]